MARRAQPRTNSLSVSPKRSWTLGVAERNTRRNTGSHQALTRNTRPTLHRWSTPAARPSRALWSRLSRRLCAPYLRSHGADARTANQGRPAGHAPVPAAKKAGDTDVPLSDVLKPGKPAVLHLFTG